MKKLSATAKSRLVSSALIALLGSFMTIEVMTLFTDSRIGLVVRMLSAVLVASADYALLSFSKELSEFLRLRVFEKRGK